MPYHDIDDPAKLQRLLQSVLLLEAELRLPVLLRHFVEEACSMAGARYGALGVLNAERTGLAEFIAVGMEQETQEMIGHPPAGKGVLGLLITDPRPLRLANIADHPAHDGFPAHHPQMKSFLGVPVGVRDEVFGNLYLAEKIGWSEFTQEDEDLVRALAQGAAIAIDNARLQHRVRESAVFHDRDRIARDLHDSVIQRLFAVGMSLQAITRVATDASITERLNRAITEIDDTIRQIRSSIFELSSAEEEKSARAEILAVVRQLDSVLGLEVQVTFDGPVDSVLTKEVLEHLVFVVREALTNVGRHAHATEATVAVRADPEWCSLTVIDNGRGFDAADPASQGFGLTNLRRRAERLSGGMEVESSPQGTKVRWLVPVADE